MARFLAIFFLVLCSFFANAESANWHAVTDQEMKKEAKDLCPKCSITEFRKKLAGSRLQLAYPPHRVRTLGEMGFHNVTDPVIPLAVRNAANSVFKVILVSSEDEDFTPLPTAKLSQQLASDWQTIKGDQVWIKEVVGGLLTDCAAAQQEKCLIPTVEALDEKSIASGTAFLANNGRLFTAGHVATDLIQKKLKQTGLKTVADLISSQARLKFYLVDAAGNTVVTPINNSARIVRADESVSKDNITEGKDIIQLELDKPLDRLGLPIASQGPRDGERVYALGFPRCTGCASDDYYYKSADDWITYGTRYPFADSPGGIMQATIGGMYGGDDTSLVTDADGAPGMSGGPSLNDKGELLGINVQISTFDFLSLTFKSLLDQKGLKRYFFQLHVLLVNPITL